MYTDRTRPTTSQSPILPIIVTAFIGYVEADVFLSVYEMAVDTILLSFCEDCGTRAGRTTPRPAHVRPRKGHLVQGQGDYEIKIDRLSS